MVFSSFPLSDDEASQKQKKGVLPRNTNSGMLYFPKITTNFDDLQSSCLQKVPGNLSSNARSELSHGEVFLQRESKQGFDLRLEEKNVYTRNLCSLYQAKMKVVIVANAYWSRFPALWFFPTIPTISNSKPRDLQIAHYIAVPDARQRIGLSLGRYMLNEGDEMFKLKADKEDVKEDVSQATKRDQAVYLNYTCRGNINRGTFDMSVGSSLILNDVDAYSGCFAFTTQELTPTERALISRFLQSLVTLQFLNTVHSIGVNGVNDGLTRPWFAPIGRDKCVEEVLAMSGFYAESSSAE